MGNEARLKTEQVRGTLLKIPFSVFAPVTVSLPLFSLIFCFVTAIIFQFDEVNKTVCQVSTIIGIIGTFGAVNTIMCDYCDDSSFGTCKGHAPFLTS